MYNHYTYIIILKTGGSVTTVQHDYRSVWPQYNMTIQQHKQQCSMDRSASWAAVQHGPQHIMSRSAAWAVVQHRPQRSMSRSAARTEAQHGPHRSMGRSAAWAAAQHGPQYRMHHSNGCIPEPVYQAFGPRILSNWYPAISQLLLFVEAYLDI